MKVHVLCTFSTKFKVSISKTVNRMMMTMMTTTTNNSWLQSQSQMRQKSNIFWTIYFQYLEGKWIYPGIQLSLCQFTSYLLQYVQSKSSGKLFQLFFLTIWRDYQGRITEYIPLHITWKSFLVCSVNTRENCWVAATALYMF